MFDGQRIKIRRAELKMGQKELSKASGIDPSTLSLYETNTREPRARAIGKLAKALRVKASYFFVNSVAHKQ